MTLNNNEYEEWEFEVGLYPGLLLGFRVYDDPINQERCFALYVPFIAISLTIIY